MPDPCSGNLSPLFDWRSAVASAHGPESSTTRHVLLTLSLWMSTKGDSCYPSQATLAEASGLARPTITRHLEKAEEEGWIVRETHGFGGQGWKRYEYVARIPRTSLKAIMDEREGGNGGLPRSRKGGNPDEGKVVTEDYMSAPVKSVKNIDTSKKDFDESLELEIQKNGGDPIPRLWDIFLEELGGSGPKPSLSTGKRKKILRALYREQLSVDDRDPFDTFKRICRAVKNSDHHMSVRSYQMPESLFRNPERRERWTHEALSGGGRHWTEDI